MIESAGTLGFAARVERDAFTLDVAFEVGSGETLVLAGPNGAGKSTCLDVLAGLIRPAQGHVRLGAEVWFDGATGAWRDPEHRRIGFVPQDRALFPHLSVRGNVEYGARARGARGGALRAAGEDWMRRLAIDSLSERKAFALSGGQQQRVALARALASGARVLLLDEPLSALDVSSRAEIRADLRRILSDVRLPAVIVTHDPTDASILGDRIAVMHAGRIAQCGTSQDLLFRPSTPFVADLIRTNLIRARLHEGSGLRRATYEGVEFHVLAGSTPSGNALLEFDPSAVVVSTERSVGSPQNVFQGTVASLVPLEDRIRMVAQVGCAIAADLTREAVADMGIAPGRSIWIAIKATAIRVHPS